MKIDKQKIFEIFLTALVSALLAFMQNIIASMSGNSILETSPEVAGAVGLVLKSGQMALKS